MTLALIWISIRSDLRHGFSKGVSLRTIKRNSSVGFNLFPVLFLRLRKFNMRVIAPLHHPQSRWNKHGYLCLSPPDFDPEKDITIYMDIALDLTTT